MARETINPEGVAISIVNHDGSEGDFISLTDIAKYKNSDSPADLIKNWLRTRSTMEYLGLWERINNDKFNNQLFQELLNESGSNVFVMSPKKWIETTNAVGLTSQSGRYGGTYAHSDIAFEFASWISPEFKLYLIKDYQALKLSDSNRLNVEWNLNRTLAKLNHKVHTDAIKSNLIPAELTAGQKSFQYANESDRINVSLFGLTAKQWRVNNPDKKGNMRDYATTEQLLVLANLESLNAYMISEKRPNEERTEKLGDTARKQMTTFLGNKKQMENIEKLT